MSWRPEPGGGPAPASSPSVAPPARHGLWVELCGLPGSGKTAVAERTAATLRARGHRVDLPDRWIGPEVARARRLARKGRLIVLAVATRPRATLAALGSVRRSRQRSLSAAVKRSVQWIVTEQLFRTWRRREPHFAIFSEGIVQAIWSLGVEGHLGADLLARVRLDPAAPRVLVAVEVDAEVARRRMAHRRSAHSRLQHLPVDDQRAQLAAGASRLDDLVGWWRDRPAGSHVLEISNPAGTAGLDAAAGALAAHLEALAVDANEDPPSVA